ncbi:MAG: DUF4870 domain-containing protein [Lyngbya sp.]|nr:DUF4870 domain-containing protein [Lyngbya sp.]
MNLEDKRRLLSALCHGSIFFSCFIVSVAIPLIIFFATQDKVIRENAKEALNFHMNLYIYGIIFTILTLLFIGIPLLILLLLMSMILPIFGIAAVFNNPNKPYRYPCIILFLR